VVPYTRQAASDTLAVAHHSIVSSSYGSGSGSSSSGVPHQAGLGAVAADDSSATLVSVQALNGDISFTGSLLSPISLKAFPFIRLNTATVAADMMVTNNNFQLRTLLIDGAGLVFGATITAKFSYDQAADAIGFVGRLDSFDIPQALISLGVPAQGLASAGLVLSDVKVTYATKPVVALEINAAGFFAHGMFTFMKMTAEVDVAVTDLGVDFLAQFDTTQLAEVS
jgi:hypothetical protein